LKDIAAYIESLPGDLVLKKSEDVSRFDSVARESKKRRS
jgi:hypothetical protein